ncbi:hypothetical protein ABPG75_013302 [Micractinium tetrahymenae]
MLVSSGLTAGRPAFAADSHRTQRAARRTARSIAVRAQKEEAAKGWKFDGSMQRWVRDDRFAGKSLTTVQPLSGTAYTVWPVMWDYLNSKGLKQVEEEEALAMVNKGAVVVDVRLASDYKNEHIAGAISVPMFRETAGNEGWDKVKRFVMGSLAMKATERDPDFLANMEKAIKNKRQQIIVACAVGGTLETVVRVASTGKSAKDPDRSFGRETRSLKACYELMQAGYTNVVHLKGGLSNWRYNGYPTESS